MTAAPQKPTKRIAGRASVLRSSAEPWEQRERDDEITATLAFTPVFYYSNYSDTGTYSTVDGTWYSIGVMFWLCCWLVLLHTLDCTDYCTVYH